MGELCRRETGRVEQSLEARWLLMEGGIRIRARLEACHIQLGKTNRLQPLADRQRLKPGLSGRLAAALKRCPDTN